MRTEQDYLDRRWTALILLCVSQFIVVLDASIVNVALPSIGKGLNFSEENLPWIVNAYVITFGGFLLLGGRAADLLGRRRVFMTGLAVVGIASLAAGFAATQGQLIAARAAQGLGAAIVSPSALSIVTMLFKDGAERNKALGAWGAVAGSAGAAGVLLGGILTDGPGLGVGAVGERPGRSDRAGVHARVDPREPLGVSDASLRRRRGRHHHGRSLVARLLPARRQQLGLGLDQDRLPAGRLRRADRRIRRRSRCGRRRRSFPSGSSGCGP